MSFFIIIRGPLGCGKTTISKKLAKILDGEYFSVDEFLDTYNLETDKEEGFISQKSFFKVNKLLIQSAKSFLDNGKVVIFDGNFYWKSQILDLIKRLDYPHYIFTLKASLDLCIKRDLQRDKMYGLDAAKAVYLKSNEFDYGFVIDSHKKINEIVDDILIYIQNIDDSSV